MVGWEPGRSKTIAPQISLRVMSRAFALVIAKGEMDFDAAKASAAAPRTD